MADPDIRMFRHWGETCPRAAIQDNRTAVPPVIDGEFVFCDEAGKPDFFMPDAPEAGRVGCFDLVISSALELTIEDGRRARGALQRRTMLVLRIEFGASALARWL